MQNYTSIEDIERDYGKRIKAAGDDAEAVRDLRTELSEAKADFREQQAQIRELAAAKRSALIEYPGAKDFEDLITGKTEDEIMAAAKAVHERAMKLKGSQAPAVDPREAAREAYGSPAAVGGGGGTPPPAKKDPNDEFLAEFARKFNAGEALTAKDYDRYERLRGGRRLAEAIAEGGKRWTMADLPWTAEAKAS